MTWSRISDDFSDDCWTLSDAAFRLHTEGLVWSNRKLLDCRIPRDDVRRFAKTPDAVAELLAVGWWTDEGDHYVIRHHAQYQRTRDEVLATQERSRKNGAKSGGRPRKPREQATDLAPVTQQVTHAGNPVANPHGNPGGRDGTGQAFEDGTTSQPEPAAQATSKTGPRIGDCSACGHREPLDEAGYCDVIECIADRVALRRVAS